MFSRRRWLQALGLHALSLGLIDWMAEYTAGEEPPPAPPLTPLNRFPRMVQEYFVEQAGIAEQACRKARANLKTRADAERYVKDAQAKIRICFGSFPEKTSLNPRVTGTVERDAYKIE